MGIHKTDRDEVVASALYKFRVNGYYKTSMADIGAGCGLLKGSIYHYFPSKEALAEAALAQVIDENQQRIFSLAYTDGSAKERLEAFAQAQAAGSASIRVDGQFVDYPLVENAKRVIELHAGAREGEV